MKKIIAFPFSILFYLVFGSILVVFHVIQIVALRGFGYQAHKTSVDFLNLCITRSLLLLGTRVSFNNPIPILSNQSYIIVSNHQSLYDIPPIIWYLRKTHPKFISKKELGKGIPSVSYNLRHGGSVLIDRKDRRQAITSIIDFGEYLTKHKRSGVIFPEGTRSRDGKLKKFHESGLQTMIKYTPEALVLPVSIQNSWKLQQWGSFPLPVGVKIQFKVHEPISAKAHTFKEIYDYCHDVISKELN